MSSPHDSALDDLMAEYRIQLGQLNDSYRKMREITATVTAVRQTVKVTVDSKGELVELQFPTHAYKQMAPIELANLLLTTIADARARAGAKVAELAKLTAPKGIDITALFGAGSDLTKALAPEPAMPDEVREYVDNGRKSGPAS